MHCQHFGIACKHAIVVQEKYQEQLEETIGEGIDKDEYITMLSRCAVGEKPCFLAEKFIEAANFLKTNRIKQPSNRGKRLFAMSFHLERSRAKGDHI